MKNSDIFYKKLWGLVLPIAIQNLLSAIVSASDALMLGMLDQQSLSAVSLATQVQFVHSLFYIAILLGMTALAAQYWGKNDKRAVEQILGIALKYSIIISLIFTLLALGCPQLLMRIFTNEETLIILGAPYLRIVGISYLFMGISQIYLCLMKNTGRTMISTVYGSSAIFINIILNGILIFGLFGAPKMEIAGAALATVVARLIELLLVLWENKKQDVARMKLHDILHNESILKKDYIQVTTPVMFNQLAWGLGFTTFSIIMGHMGNDAVAANALANIVKNLIACVCLGVGVGSGIMVGNELGKGDLDKARAYGDKLCHIAIILGMITGVIIVAISPIVLHFASNMTMQSREYLKLMLFVCGYYIVGKSINCTVIPGIFSAGGDTKFGLICDTVTMWGIVIPIGLIAAFVLKLPVMVVYLLLNTDEIIKLPVVYCHYKKYRWVKNLTREQVASCEA